jgi:hypothetical protein
MDKERKYTVLDTDEWSRIVASRSDDADIIRLDAEISRLRATYGEPLKDSDDEYEHLESDQRHMQSEAIKAGVFFSDCRDVPCRREIAELYTYLHYMARNGGLSRKAAANAMLLVTFEILQDSDYRFDKILSAVLRHVMYLDKETDDHAVDAEILAIQSNVLELVNIKRGKRNDCSK